MGLTASNEDYLRAIWKLEEWQDHPATSGELARALGLSPSTVSEGVSRLVSLGLVRHAPYGAISLTDEGRKQAARMVRIHRVLETGLVQLFGYSWDEVNAEAEQLEHAVSDLFIERLDAALGHPQRDPHGDIIPLPSGEIPDTVAAPDEQIRLCDLAVGEGGRVERVSDTDSDVLVYLDELGVVPGTRLRVTGVRRGVGIVRVSVSDREFDVALNAAQVVLVAVDPDAAH
jgi:DtxR family Mn-dependent transcriptional regulator